MTCGEILATSLTEKGLKFQISKKFLQIEKTKPHKTGQETQFTKNANGT